MVSKLQTDQVQLMNNERGLVGGSVKMAITQ